MKRISILALFLSVLLIFSACGKKEALEISLGYGDGTIHQTDDKGDEILKGLEYNQDKFYRNDLTLDTVADPTTLYEDGVIYVYGTDATFGTRGFGCWASHDGGIHWECEGVAFQPERESWGYSDLWAPEIIHDPKTDLYYLTYSARNSNTFANGGSYYANNYIGMAYASRPQGPFVQYTGTNLNGDEIGLGDPIFNPALITHLNGVEYEQGYFERYRFIDSSYFIDDGGQIYMYLARAQDVHNILTDEDEKKNEISMTTDIWGVKMKDFATPDYSTVTQLTKVGYNTVNGDLNDINDIDVERTSMSETGAKINEGPIMTKHEGVYYLTYSVGGGLGSLYSVAQAHGNSALGNFRKLTKAEGGLVIGTDPKWTQNAGAGHHSFVNVGNEMFIVHHEGRDRYTMDMTNRAVAINRVFYLDNGSGKKVLTANGPTSFSLQALPAEISGYKNIAPEATVSANGLSNGSHVKYLTDGVFACHDYGIVKETEFNVNEVITIKLEWSDYRTIGALMLYNSIDYNKIFYQIAQIKFAVKTPSGAECNALVKNATFPLNQTTSYQALKFMFAGNNMVLDFNDMAVKSIEITLKAPRTSGKVAISDIWVLGK